MHTTTTNAAQAMHSSCAVLEHSSEGTNVVPVELPPVLADRVADALLVAFLNAPTIEYRPEWANGTGYLNGAVYHRLTIGERAQSVCPAGRKIYLFGNGAYGTVVIFQRYNDTDCWVRNTPRQTPLFREILPNGRLSWNNLMDYLVLDIKLKEGRATHGAYLHEPGIRDDC